MQNWLNQITSNLPYLKYVQSLFLVILFLLLHYYWQSKPVYFWQTEEESHLSLCSKNQEESRVEKPLPAWNEVSWNSWKSVPFNNMCQLEKLLPDFQKVGRLENGFLQQVCRKPFWFLFSLRAVFMKDRVNLKNLSLCRLDSTAQLTWSKGKQSKWAKRRNFCWGAEISSALQHQRDDPWRPTGTTQAFHALIFQSWQLCGCLSDLA